MKRLCAVFLMLALFFVMCDTSYAGWREGLANIGKRIQGATRRAIDWGAEKFKPAYKDHIVPAGQTMTDTYYDETRKIIDSPGSFAADQTPGLGDVRAADSISDKAARGDYTGAAAETASAAVDAVTPPVLGTGVAATAKGLARVGASYLGSGSELVIPFAEAGMLLPDSVSGASRAETHHFPNGTLIHYYSSGPRFSPNPRAGGTSTENVLSLSAGSETRQGQDIDLAQLDNNYTITTLQNDNFATMVKMRFSSEVDFYIKGMGSFNSQGYIDAGVKAILDKIKSVKESAGN